MENTSQQTITSTNASQTVITEKKYPITILWIFKAPIIIIVVNLIALLFGYIYPYLILALPVMLIVNPLIRANFHYSLEDKFLSVRQGVISKKQRNLPYGVIQNIFVKQDLFDRIFGLAALKIENAVQGGEKRKYFRFAMANNQQEDFVGSSGNKVNIPGLKKQDAEELKNNILQKVKENPIDDKQSGL